jgi:RNA polymerase sigma-70 factor (ECF subfamily)
MDDVAMDGAHKFCRQVRPRLVGTILLVLGDVHVAEELAQETLARVWVNWATLGPLDDMARRAWAYRVAMNLANSWWRRRMAERRAVTRLSSRQVDSDPADALAVRAAVRALPPRQRTALVLRYYADLSVDEVASLMRCAPGTVKALTNQALNRLRTVVRELEEA